MIIDIEELKQRNKKSKIKENNKNDLFCSRDIVKIYNVSSRRARKKIETMLAKNEIELVEYRKMNINGGHTIMPMYRYI